jgi:transposase InsO family protein
MAAELHKPAVKHFKRAQVFTRGIDDVWAADLSDMNEFKKDNKNIRYILTVIDCFSRHAWASPIKDKTGDTVLNALKKIITTSGRKPARLWIDQGKEFVNKKMTNWLKENEIQPYHTYGEHKSAMVERFNRTLKSIMWKNLTELQSNDWVSILPALMDEYNNKYHSTIKMTPNQASRKRTKINYGQKFMKTLKKIQREKNTK